MATVATLKRPFEVKWPPEAGADRGKPNPRSFHLTNTKNSPACRGLWLKLKNAAVPDAVHLMLLSSALRQQKDATGVLNIGPFKTQVALATDFLNHYKSSLPSQALDADLLPGVDWLGYGYRPFGLFMNSDWATREPLFQFPSWDYYSFNQKEYAKPAIVTALDENEAEVTKIDEHAVAETISEIYGNLTTGAEWGLFRGELELAYSRSLARHWEYRAAYIQMIMRMMRLTLPDQMREYLTPAFKAVLDCAAEDAQAKAEGRKMPHRTNFTTFFDTWGTHYISGIHVGGAYNFYMLFQNSGYRSVEEIDAKVNALYLGLSTANTVKISQAMNLLDEHQEVSVTVFGGVDVPTDWTDLAHWQIAVRANPAGTSFYGDQMQGLTPIYALVADASRQRALQVEWQLYCSRKKLDLPGIGTVVTALNVGCDKHESDAMAQAAAGGFNVIPVDMNEGAGGPFIFVGVKYGDGDADRPLLDLVAVTGSSTVQAPVGYYRYPTDLNKGVGGDFIYLCSTNDLNGRELLLPIRNVSAEVYDNAQNAEFFSNRGFTAVPEVGSTAPLDMNRRAHGKFVYITFTRMH